MLTQVSGSKVLDEFGDALASGAWSFSNGNGLVASFSITRGAFSGQLTAPVNGVVTITNATTGVIVLTMPDVCVSGTAWTWDYFRQPSGTLASGWNVPNHTARWMARYLQRGQTLPAGFPPNLNGLGVNGLPTTWCCYLSSGGAPYIWMQCPPSGVPAQGTNYPGINDSSGNSPGYPSGY